MNSENKIYQIPEFISEYISVKEAARIMGKDYQFVWLGLIEGILPIGTAYKMNDSSVYSFYISPRLFCEYTGYVYRGKKRAVK
ncbi:MAG: hypothetical protein IJE43_03285 [Alphaproteobacteria bacterium]|nr:hypothetical protein [Alphaproteobacteria bacterium]MBQ6995467.1 hypothetical protein [Lachnospiraceae bacterium]